MLSNFVDGDATLFGGVLAQVQSRVDLFAKNSLESYRQGFAQFQTESHGRSATSARVARCCNVFRQSLRVQTTRALRICDSCQYLEIPPRPPQDLHVCPDKYRFQS